MDTQNAFIFLLILLPVQWAKARGHDFFEGIFEGAPCFKPRDIIGCSGTLVANFKPTAELIGPNKPDTMVFLFTNINPDEPEYLHDCGGTLPSNTYFDFKVPTEVFVHGYFDGTCRTSWMREMKDQLFKRGRYNVILIDWTWGNSFDLAIAGLHTKYVGQQLGFVLNNLVGVMKRIEHAPRPPLSTFDVLKESIFSGRNTTKKKLGANPKDIHIVGHSFGSHVAGFAGKTVPGLGRVTALDPALEPFKFSPPEERLSRLDANLVDAIHTNAGDCCPIVGFGSIYPWSHADFYPNGGKININCYSYIIPSLLKGDIFYGFFSLIPQFCSHLQSIQYYKLSINPGDCEFIGHECESYESFKSGSCDASKCAIMGMNFAKSGFAKNGTDGYRKYYLHTGFNCPYCIQEECEGHPPPPFSKYSRNVQSKMHVITVEK